jgi:site-specific DNA recombinase
VLDCLPVTFFSIGAFETMSANVIAEEEIRQELKELERRQKAIIQQIADRAAEGRPRLSALDDTLDQLEAQREALAKQLSSINVSKFDMAAKIADLRQRHNPDQTELRMRHFMLMARKGDNEDAKRQLMPIVRHLVQRVVIGKTPGHQPASLQVHGLIASILAQMDVLTLMERRFIADAHADFEERMRPGEIDSEAEKQMLLDICEEELRERKRKKPAG